MKKLILLVLFVGCLNIGFSQIYLPKYRSINQQDMMSVPAMMAQRAQNTRNYLDQLTLNILELRSKVTDPILDKYLSAAYKGIIAFYDYDLADNRIIAQIKAKDREIREYLVDYSKKEESNPDPKNNQTTIPRDSNQIIGNTILVNSNCEMYENPTYESSYKAKIDKGEYVVLLGFVDDMWCKIKRNGYEGYMVKLFLSFPK